MLWSALEHASMAMLHAVVVCALSPGYIGLCTVSHQVHHAKDRTQTPQVAVWCSSVCLDLCVAGMGRCSRAKESRL